MAKFVESTNALTNGADTLAAADRQGLIIGNLSDTVMSVRFGGVATATVGIVLGAGQNITLQGRHAPDTSVTIFCAGTAKTYTAYEW